MGPQRIVAQVQIKEPINIGLKFQPELLPFKVPADFKARASTFVVWYAFVKLRFNQLSMFI